MPNFGAILSRKVATLFDGFGGDGGETNASGTTRILADFTGIDFKELMESVESCPGKFYGYRAFCHPRP
jgi:hypothetical protein